MSAGELSTLVQRLPDDAPLASFVVVVIGGQDGGISLEVDGAFAGPALIGTSSACHLRLGDREVSRRHAALDNTPRGLRIRDLGSTNGVHVGGVAVGEAFLKGGEIVVVGRTSLRVARSDIAGVAPPRASRFGRMLGASAAMRRLYPLCERLAAADVPVLIEGETGTGKEVLAEALHEKSPRAAGPFCVFDCAAVSDTLVESTLFGHTRGAFTGASHDRRGAFEEADGGTLLIDEIGELPLSLQPKLLRSLDRGELQRVGSNTWTKVSVRVLAATRRDLDREVQAGRFRDDLFFRLAVGRVHLPPLRERTGDVTLLAHQFWRSLSATGEPLTEEVLARLEDYGWPGNVRELRNALARLAALGVLEPETGTAPPSGAGRSPDVIREVIDAGLPFVRARDKVMSEFERRFVEATLARHGGSVARASAASGIARRYFQLIRARTKASDGT